MSEFLTPLRTEWIDDDNFYPLSPLRFRSDLLGGIIEAEAGFLSDGSSTPRVPGIWELYGNRAHHEGVIHDRGYRAKPSESHPRLHVLKIERPNGVIEMIEVSKNQIDSVFKEAMIARGKPWYVIYGMWLGVVLGGRRSWKTGYERFKILNTP